MLSTYLCSLQCGQLPVVLYSAVFACSLVTVHVDVVSVHVAIIILLHLLACDGFYDYIITISCQYCVYNAYMCKSNHVVYTCTCVVQIHMYMYTQSLSLIVVATYWPIVMQGHAGMQESCIFPSQR